VVNVPRLSDLYRIRFPADELPRKNAVWQVICRSFLSRFIASSDTVVDIACGYGEFLNNILARNRIGIDINADAGRFLNPDIQFTLCSAIELSHTVNAPVDVVFTSNFLEHLPGKQILEELLDQVRAILKPGGRFLILGPNLRYLPGAYWDYYDHHLGLTHLSLIEILRLKGFEIELCLDRFLPYTTRGALPTHPWLVWLYLQLPLFWPMLGKQFFIVAKRAIQ
jgi:SAM-dependent methyltransferase